MQLEKIDKIIDVIIEIPNEKWKQDIRGHKHTEIKGKKIKLQYAYSGMRPSIVIDEVDIFDEERRRKVWELYIRLNNYFEGVKDVIAKSSIEHIYTELIENK